MDVLCDQHVPEKYVRALSAVNGITVATVRDMLSADASDGDIAAFAAKNGWVVFTNDDDFYKQDARHGLLVYSQLNAPTPGAVVEAVTAIGDAYADDADIIEVVPGAWT